MSRQVYYCVAVDLDTNEIVIDYGTTFARFADRLENVWDGQEWRDFEGDEAHKADSLISQVIPARLKETN